LWQLGYPDQALEVDSRMRELAHALGHPFTLAYAHCCSGWLHQHCRLGSEAEASGDEQLRIAADQSFPGYQASGTLFKASGMMLQGRADDAVPLLEKGLDFYRGTWGAGLTCYRSIAGETYTKVGRFDDAKRILDEGLVRAEKTDERFQEAELYRLKGELLLADSADQAAAEGCFRTAIETARRQQSKAWELRGTMSLARLWQGQGRREEGRAALAAVYGTFTEGFTTPDLVDAAALLKALA
jgi:predicted ATPase